VYDDPITVGYVVKDREGVVCDDSCEFAFDGVCDDGTESEYYYYYAYYGYYMDDDLGGYYGEEVSVRMKMPTELRFNRCFREENMKVMAEDTTHTMIITCLTTVTESVLVLKVSTCRLKYPNLLMLMTTLFRH
jgi:hypothetical protein